MPTTIQFRRGTAAEWTSANSVLASGEPGFETDTLKFKIGDGTTAWNSLAYEGGGASAFTDLTDVPASYSGQAGKAVVVNGSADGLEFVTPSGGGGSSPYTMIARVDPNGDDGTGTVGDFMLPFQTVAAAVAAIEALSDLPNRYYVDIGVNYFDEDITTSLRELALLGYDASNAGITSITFTDSLLINFVVIGCVCYSVDANLSSNGLNVIPLNGAYVGNVTNTGSGTYINVGGSSYIGGQCENVTSNGGPVTLEGLSFAGTIDAGGGDITVKNCMPGNPDYVGGSNILEINSVGSNCTVSLSLIKVTAANDLTLYDSRIYGANGASGTTTNTDYFLS